MCQPCDKRKDWMPGYISYHKIEMQGICHLIHGTPNGDQQPPAHDQVATRLLNPPRQTSQKGRTPVVPFSAGPVNESKMLVDFKKGGSNSWSKRLQNVILKSIADPINAQDGKIGRAVVRHFAITGGASDKENINKPCGGMSKSAKSKSVNSAGLSFDFCPVPVPRRIRRSMMLRTSAAERSCGSSGRSSPVF